MRDSRFQRYRSFSTPCEKMASFLIFSPAVLRGLPADMRVCYVHHRAATAEWRFFQRLAWAGPPASCLCPAITQCKAATKELRPCWVGEKHAGSVKQTQRQYSFSSLARNPLQMKP
jgi:hypothetical protein